MKLHRIFLIGAVSMGAFAVADASTSQFDVAVQQQF